jgi:choline dehydrogenase-like flavoprotein
MFQLSRYSEIAFRPGFSIPCNLLHPKSRGRVRLRSRNPDDNPVIEAGYFSHPDDMKTLIEAIRFVARLGVASPLKKHGAEVIAMINGSQCTLLSMLLLDVFDAKSQMQAPAHVK